MSLLARIPKPIVLFMIFLCLFLGLFHRFQNIQDSTITKFTVTSKQVLATGKYMAITTVDSITILIPDVESIQVGDELRLTK